MALSNGNGCQKVFGRANIFKIASLQNSNSGADTAFANVGKRNGLEIWRVEKLRLVVVPASEFGKFYSNDAYIVLYTSLNTGVRTIHFWQGEECSLDDLSVAAYKSVELDILLGGGLLQYREMEGHETEQFMSYFKTGIRYVDRGANVEPGQENEMAEKRLYHIKGKHNCRAFQVERSVESLSQDGVFMLDSGWNIFLWVGPVSSRSERLKGAELATFIRDEERQGQSCLHVIEQDWDTNEQFYAELDTQVSTDLQIKAASFDNADWLHDRKEVEEIKLFNISEKCGRLEAKDIRTRPLNKKLLDTNECFILDMENMGVYVWVGKRCPMGPTIDVWKLALEFLRFRNYPKWSPVSRVPEGFEPWSFKQAFASWPSDTKNGMTGGNECPKTFLKTKDYIPDDGTGEVQVWRVENFYMAPVDKAQYGRFYSADSYIILYKYFEKNVEKGIVYFWQGLHSNQDEKGASIMMAAKVDEKEMGGQAVLIRVVQNKEPAHLLKIFQNKMVVLMGGRKTEFQNRIDSDCYDAEGTRLFQIRDGRIVQVPEKASSLISSDVFILEAPRTTYIWYGKTTSDEGKKLAKECAKRVIALRNPQMIDEGTEPDEFWQFLGGQPKTSNSKQTQPLQLESTIRLFHLSSSHSHVRVEEVVDFEQQDLFDEDIMLLDCYDELYVWIGREASSTAAKKDAVKMAIEYIRTDPYGRQIDNTIIVVVKQGYESLPFADHFSEWRQDMWEHFISFDDLKREFDQANSKLIKVSESLKKSDRTYPLEVLMSKDVPEGVDPGRKEFHLSEEEFLRVFQTSRAEYMKLPQWKRVDLKKKTGLF